MFSLAVNPIMPLGRDNYLSTLEFLKGVSKSTQAVCLSGDFYSTTSWRWFVYYLRWICSSLHLQRITAVIKLQGQGKGRQAGRESLLPRLACSGALPRKDVWYSKPSNTRQAVINQRVWSEVNIHQYLIIITAIEMIIFMHLSFTDGVMEGEWKVLKE